MYPGLAVAGALRELAGEVEVLFLCTERAIDREILEKNGWSYQAQPVGPLPSPKRPWRAWDFLRRWRGSVRMCRGIMKERRPAAVLGLGGFASGPALKAAAQEGIATGMLNPDAVPGIANRYCRRFAEKIFVQWEKSREFFGKEAGKCVVTGCPIRKEFEERKAQSAERQEKKVLVIMGGSQGGRNVNKAVVHWLTGKDFEKTGPGRGLGDWEIVHVTGETDREWVGGQYRENRRDVEVIGFTHEMPKLLSETDLVVSRAGASSLAELTALGVPSILIPYPYHTDQHQLRNAEVLAGVEAAQIVIDRCDEERTAGELNEAMQVILRQEGTLEKMAAAARELGRPAAARQVAKELLSWGK